MQNRIAPPIPHSIQAALVFQYGTARVRNVSLMNPLIPPFAYYLTATYCGIHRLFARSRCANQAQGYSVNFD